MKGLLIYSKVDFKRNEGYIHWLVNEAGNKGMALTLVFEDEFFLKGLTPDLQDLKFVINRSRNYEISLLFELNGIRVFNNSEITLLGNNKLAGYKHALNRGIPFSKLCLQWHDEATKILSKPNYGHGGEGIALVDDLKEPTDSQRIQQAYVENAIGDVRFYILNNQVVHAVLRKASSGLVSNYSQGGAIEIFNYTDEHLYWVNKYLAGLAVDYAGLDFIVTTEGQLLFNEMEDVVGSRMLSELGINDTTELFFEHIKSQLKLP